MGTVLRARRAAPIRLGRDAIRAPRARREPELLEPRLRGGAVLRLPARPGVRGSDLARVLPGPAGGGRAAPVVRGAAAPGGTLPAAPRRRRRAGVRPARRGPPGGARGPRGVPVQGRPAGAGV